jgi:4-hydroxybenzoyl-CoA thioesterase
MLSNQRTIAVEWGDCDAAGIVFFPRYFEWFDACTAALFQRAGFEKRALLATYGIIGIPVVEARATFRRPSSFGDTVIVDSTIARWGRSSFDVQHRLHRDGELAVEGFETRVWAVRTEDGATIRSQAIPQEVIARFSR